MNAARGAGPATTSIVLLRGVNVGRAKRVPMAEFRGVLEEVGCSKVRTLLNSGNAVVVARRADPDRLARRIAERMRAHFAFEVPVLVKPADVLRRIIAGNTLAPGFDPSRLLVVFAREPAALAALRPLESLLLGEEQLLIGTDAAYLHCAAGILASKAAGALLAGAGSDVTTRNWSTVLKLQASAESLA